MRTMVPLTYGGCEPAAGIGLWAAGDTVSVPPGMCPLQTWSSRTTRASRPR